MDFNITIEGLDKIIAGAEEAGANLQPLMKAALNKSAATVQGIAREQAPHRTGNLQRSILYQVDYPIANVNVNEKYGLYVETGTAPHDIVPKNKKALFWAGAANPYKIVHHPGTRANPFFARAVEMSQEPVKLIYQEVADTIVTQMAGV